MTKKILLLIVLALTLTGCENKPEFSGVSKAEFNLAGEKVYIGGEGIFGTGEDKFIPSAKLEKWGDETSLTITAKDDVRDKAIKDGEKVISESRDGKREYHFYSKQIDNEIDALELELILKEKPKTNIFEWNIDLKGIDCFYQLPLNEEEWGTGLICSATECKDEKGRIAISRPEDVVGSYACYHQSKSGDFTKMGGKNYMTGKAFHIYRPEIIDARGNKIWGELNNDLMITGKLSVTISAAWLLGKAEYPVRVDPTIGYTSGGASNDWWSAHTRSNLYTATEATGTISKISFYAYEDRSGDLSMKATIENADDLNDVYLITNGVGTGTLVPSSVAWTDDAFPSAPTLTNGSDYFITVVITASSDNFAARYDSNAMTFYYNYFTPNYTTPTDWGTIDIDFASSSSKQYSVYATYGGGEPPPPATNETKQQIIIFGDN